MKKLENFSQLSDTEIKREIEGCKDKAAFIEEACEVNSYFSFISEALVSIKTQLKKVDPAAFSSTDIDYLPLLTETENNIHPAIKTANHYLTGIGFHIGLMIKASGYDRDRALRLYFNFMALRARKKAQNENQ